MTNQALPQKSRQMVANYLDRCRNLGLILDKFAPWGEVGSGGWDLLMRSTVRQKGQNQVRTLTGGEAKGIWLSTSRRAINDESRSLFEVSRTDSALMAAKQQRWVDMIRGSGGFAFTMAAAERLAAGLGASHVLETALILERNTGLPYLPGSSVKGLARAWGLIEVAAQLQVTLDATDSHGNPLLNTLAAALISEADENLLSVLSKQYTATEDALAFTQWFRIIFGWQGEAGAICFVDAIYAGDTEPRYVADVMTPHYVNYYTEKGGRPPSEDDNPNPVSFITVDRGNVFAFGLIPRAYNENTLTAIEIAADWLANGLSRLGAGSKTTAGYGFFNRRSYTPIVEVRNP
jgi:CRISPR-associated protein Cmr6